MHFFRAFSLPKLMNQLIGSPERDQVRLSRAFGVVAGLRRKLTDWYQNPGGSTYQKSGLGSGAFIARGWGGGSKADGSVSKVDGFVLESRGVNV